MTTPNAAAAFKYAADELIEFTKNNPASSSDDSMIMEAVGSCTTHEKIRPIVMEALEMSQISYGFSHILKHSENLPDAVIALHLFSSLLLAARVADDPLVLMAVLTMEGPEDE